MEPAEKDNPTGKEASPDVSPAPVEGAAGQPVALPPSAVGLKGGSVKLAMPGVPPPPEEPQPVVLRVEVATKAQARILAFSVLILNALFILLAFALLGLRQAQNNVTPGKLRETYVAKLAIGGTCLAICVFMAVWYGLSMRRTKREKRAWSARQSYFVQTVGITLVLQILYAATYVSAFAVVLAQPNCAYPWISLTVLSFLQWTFFSAMLFFLMARVSNLTIWRGEGLLEMDPDHMLVVDRPLADKAKKHSWLLAIWVVLEGMALLKMAGRIVRLQRKGGNTAWREGCNVDMNEFPCRAPSSQIISAALTLILICIFVYCWVRAVQQALRDHGQLPYNRYKATHIFIRVQARVMAPVLTAVVLSVLLLDVLAAFNNNCWAAMDAGLGNMPVLLSLTVAVAVLAFLYVPKNSMMDSPLQQEFLQAFSWTRAGLSSQIEQRQRRMEASEAAVAQETGLEQVVGFLPGLIGEGLGKLRGVPDMASTRDQLLKEPMFCMESAVRLFYWMRLAYRSDFHSDKFVNAEEALRLFDLEHFEAVWDDNTDTHCVMGWSKTTAVVAFRGTASIQNAITDIKAWRVPLKPKHRHHGRSVSVHAGFYSAWLHEGFDAKVLGKLKELDKGPTPMRFWITGHSLGGALAVLASHAIAKQHPNSQLTCYTYGCPRVGNGAFAAEYNEAVPDTWAILNGEDPIPWIPKVGFKRVGKRVTIDAKGNLILRPSYFELSVVHRGTTAKHHTTGSYALSLAAIIKSQFVDSKKLPDGEKGVEQLSAAVDLSKTLILTHVDLKSLADSSLQPQLSEALAARASKKQRREDGEEQEDGGCCGGGSLRMSWKKKGGTQADGGMGEGQGDGEAGDGVGGEGGTV